MAAKPFAIVTGLSEIVSGEQGRMQGLGSSKNCGSGIKMVMFLKVFRDHGAESEDAEGTALRLGTGDFAFERQQGALLSGKLQQQAFEGSGRGGAAAGDRLFLQLRVNARVRLIDIARKCDAHGVNNVGLVALAPPAGAAAKDAKAQAGIKSHTAHLMNVNALDINFLIGVMRGVGTEGIMTGALRGLAVTVDAFGHIMASLT